MYKKSRITALKHRATRKKMRERRGLARRLISGDITIDQLDRLAAVCEPPPRLPTSIDEVLES